MILSSLILAHFGVPEFRVASKEVASKNSWKKNLFCFQHMTVAKIKTTWNRTPCRTAPARTVLRTVRYVSTGRDPVQY